MLCQLIRNVEILIMQLWTHTKPSHSIPWILWLKRKPHVIWHKVPLLYIIHILTYWDRVQMQPVCRRHFQIHRHTASLSKHIIWHKNTSFSKALKVLQIPHFICAIICRLWWDMECILWISDLLCGLPVLMLFDCFSFIYFIILIYLFYSPMIWCDRFVLVSYLVAKSVLVLYCVNCICVLLCIHQYMIHSLL